MVVTIFVVHCAHYILLAFDTNYIENKNRLNKERHIRNGYARKIGIERAYYNAAQI